MASSLHHWTSQLRAFLQTEPEIFPVEKWCRTFGRRARYTLTFFCQAFLLIGLRHCRHMNMLDMNRHLAEV